MHPLLRLHDHVSGVPAQRRPQLWRHLFGTDRNREVPHSPSQTFRKGALCRRRAIPGCDGERQDLPPRAGKQFYIFLAIGLATYVARPRRLTDACFIAAAEVSADQIGPDLRARGMLFPGQADILETEVATATRVSEFMFDEDLAQVKRPRDSLGGSRVSFIGRSTDGPARNAD
jgi:Malic enzyme, NAD binding domain